MGSAPDEHIAALPAVSRLLRRVADDPAAPLTVTVVGPGGTGKSAVLDAVAHVYTTAGVEVLRADPEQALPDGGLDPDVVVLVDDAHRLSGPALETLRTHAGGTRLVVAYRRWPSSRALSALTARASRHGGTLVVGHLDREAVGTRMARRLGRPPADIVVGLVHEQSGGLPRLVDVVTQALIDSGRLGPEPFCRPDRITVSAALAERMRHYVDDLDPEVHALLETMAVGATLETEVLAPLLAVGPDELIRNVEAGRASGLLTDSGELIPFVQNLLLRLTPLLRTRELQRRLAELQFDRGGSVLRAGRQLMGTGASGSRVAAVLEAAGDEALTDSPAVAADLYASAVEAGGTAVSMAARRARAVAMTGDLTQASRLADDVLADPAAPDREQAIAVAAAVLAHRGLLARSADLFRCLPATAAGGPALAVPALIGTGALADAGKVLHAAQESGSGPSTLLAGAGMMMARGMLNGVTGSAPAALSQLARAAVLMEPIAATVFLPDTPAALTTLVALHCGELPVAEAALRRADAEQQGGRPARLRHLLLRGWLALTRGQLDTVRRVLHHADLPGAGHESRDELFVAALAVAVQRRDGDDATLAVAWSRARTALVHHPVDLYTLLPLGELAVAAARLGERDWIAASLDDAWRLLAELGEPMLWTVPLHWYELQAALLSSRVTQARRHAAALVDAGPAGPFAAGLAAAGACWLQVDRAEIDVDAVVRASRKLHDLGLRWEGAHLAGQAAVRTTDRRAAATLHACARTVLPAPAGSPAQPAAGDPAEADAILHGGAESPSSAPAAPDGPRPDHQATDCGEQARGEQALSEQALSDRELDIGRLVLAGLTHKQIGERLFISAKTVEHHVARMRRRLGVESRTELFGRLRVLLGSPAGQEPAGSVSIPSQVRSTTRQAPAVDRADIGFSA